MFVFPGRTSKEILSLGGGMAGAWILGPWPRIRKQRKQKHNRDPRGQHGTNRANPHRFSRRFRNRRRSDARSAAAV